MVWIVGDPYCAWRGSSVGSRVCEIRESTRRDGIPLAFFFSWAGIPIFGAKGDGGTSSHGGMFDVL